MHDFMSLFINQKTSQSPWRQSYLVILWHLESTVYSFVHPLKLIYKLRPWVASGFMDGSLHRLMDLVRGNPNIQKKRQGFEPTYRCFGCATQTSRCLGMEEEQHFINNILPHSKDNDMCMNNPKEQINGKYSWLPLYTMGGCYSGHFALL